MISFRCPGSCQCGAMCAVEDNLAGCTIDCPNSGETIRVPARSFSGLDWITDTDPEAMLYALPDVVSNRKLRLFALACCERVSLRLKHHLSRQALVMAAGYAEGQVTDEEMQGLSQRFMDEHNARLAAVAGHWDAMDTTDLDAAFAMTLKVFPASAASRALRAAENPTKERAMQCQLLRCVFGNPFRPLAVDSSWMTSAVISLAQAIYDDRAFDRLPVLADALEEGGCANAAILGHCRGPSPHVRGCSVVDLLLGKE
jgi:hypothetical protein